MSEVSDTGRAGRYGLYALIVGASIFVAGLAQLRIDGIFACPASYGEAAYLAYCQARGYGDYDRGGFWFDFEPETARAAADAEVLFVGSSRMQFAFSSAATQAWFATHAATYYLLGFSHTENIQFIGPLLDRIQPKAKVYVINVDRFFDDRITEPTEVLFHDPDVGKRYAAKKRWQSVHATICPHLGAFCGTHAAFYRHRTDGRWHLAGYEPEFLPAPVSDGPADPRARPERYAELAEQFMSRLPVSRSCVILTLVPYSGTKREEARFVAERLDAELIEPRAGILRTFDGSHLDPESAERWSEAFLERAGTRIARCMARIEEASGP
jgi:hypothetical protein